MASQIHLDRPRGCLSRPRRQAHPPTAVPLCHHRCITAASHAMFCTNRDFDEQVLMSTVWHATKSGRCRLWTSSECGARPFVLRLFLYCFTCPAITVAAVVLRALDRVRGRALGWLGPGSPKSQPHPPPRLVLRIVYGCCQTLGIPKNHESNAEGERCTTISLGEPRETRPRLISLTAAVYLCNV